MTMSTWSELAAYQPKVLKLLGNSIEKNRLAHAYLFEGKRGTGKKEISLLLARRFFCENPEDYTPCETCRNCKRIHSGNHPDVHLVEPDGLSIKKWQIQDLQGEFTKTGVESSKKLYIISHADKMTANAANSLLKFLEEPNANTMAILMTEQVHQILNTIISRCQTLTFQTLPAIAIEKELMKHEVSANFAKITARITNNIEKALELSRDDWFAQARLVVIKLYEVLSKRKGQAFVHVQTQWMPFFTEKDQQDMGLDLLLYLYKDILSIQIGNTEHVIYQDLLPQLEQHAIQVSRQKVLEKITSILEAKKRLQANVSPQLLMEQLVLSLQEG
ncbi:DNA polymerase III subunit delta' [Bacillus sp. UMB0893]|nr:MULTISPECIES: DNA polymerase III subunit delta' [Bacillaceae]PLR65726.1 DNA polymerase III subunit delta' [Bacillus sp. UMB0893]